MAENSTAISPAAHLTRYQWQRGQTGNPGGRPKLPLELVKAKPLAAARLVALLESEDEGIALKAVALVLAYNLGTPGPGETVQLDRPDVMREGLRLVGLERPDLLLEAAEALKSTPSTEVK